MSKKWYFHFMKKVQMDREVQKVPKILKKSYLFINTFFSLI